MKLIYVLADMELTGIMIDTKYLEDMKIVIKDKLDKLEREIYDLAGEEFNIMSTKQLSDILFVKLGINYPKKGDYVKINLQMKDSKNDNIIFDSTLSRRKFCEIRYLTNESNMFPQLEKEIGDMSLFEKRSIELTKENYDNSIPSSNMLNLLNVYEKIIIFVEIVNISKSPTIL